MRGSWGDAECIFMSLCLSSFWVVWSHRHTFSPPSLLLSSGRPAKQIPPYLLSCSLFANFPSSFSHSLPSGSFLFLYFPAASTCSDTASHFSSPPSHHPSAFPSSSLFVYSKPTLPFSFLLFSSSTLLSSPPPPPPCPPHPSPYRWRLTWERSAIRPPDCLLLRRWMEAPSASLTQPQLHQPP